MKKIISCRVGFEEIEIGNIKEDYVAARREEDHVAHRWSMDAGAQSNCVQDHRLRLLRQINEEVAEEEEEQMVEEELEDILEEGEKTEVFGWEPKKHQKSHFYKVQYYNTSIHLL
ncbi:hypothetical protein GCK72_012703 [Caenorhabditis remanei]|uniref:Uncharacterized protein n=1 Tax=Caenorhabditis remanei TaxID=31234 RepID=A0A6A5GCS9_CAERE|nr:hypothetical protein GCK72_019503 [Caenorhabditis remanei]XP_053584106.1 hypothetical protein GCK72_012703 [Caenorhabditis remanei]KAF1752948.1 hypothetical protein GCK72_019503 [Caenorhabditis remanei]KAF1756250.1 hypothetical protein GCK72_012703 [Caenorhabditis remanei]